MAAVDELQVKIAFINNQLISCQYDTAGHELITVIVDMAEVEEKFKIDDADFKNSFTPLFVAAIILKIPLYLEGIKYHQELGLSQEQVSQLKSLLQSDALNSNYYLSKINPEIAST